MAKENPKQQSDHQEILSEYQKLRSLGRSKEAKEFFDANKEVLSQYYSALNH